MVFKISDIVTLNFWAQLVFFFLFAVLCHCNGNVLAISPGLTNDVEIEPFSCITKSEIKKDSLIDCVLEKYINNEMYFEFYNKKGVLVKSVSRKDFINNAYKKYDIKSLEKASLKPLVESGYIFIDSLNTTQKKTILHSILQTLPTEKVIENAESINIYGGNKGNALIWLNKFIIFKNSIYIFDNNDWGPAWAETTIVIFDHMSKPIGKIVGNKLLEKITLSDDGKFLLAEIHGFSKGEGGDDGIEGFQIFNVISGKLISTIPYLRKNGHSDSVEFKNGLFRITTNTWQNNMGMWRFCIDPINRKYYKKLYFPSDPIWEGKAFPYFIGDLAPNGIEENLSDYEAISF